MKKKPNKICGTCHSQYICSQAFKIKYDSIGRRRKNSCWTDEKGLTDKMRKILNKTLDYTH